MSIYVDIEKQVGSVCLKVKFDTMEKKLAVLGKSGSGKSMLLQCIAGLEKPDKGKIVLNGVTVFDSEKRINVPTRKRQVFLLSRTRKLFPFFTVLQNIRMKVCRGSDKTKRVTMIPSVMEQLGITELSSRYPNQLSEGERWLVLLAQGILSGSAVLLVDEPVAPGIQQLSDLGQLVVLATCNPDMAYQMAEQIAVMDEGKIQPIRQKNDLFSDPQTKATAMLTGCENISRIECLENGEIWATDWDVVLQSRNVPEGTSAIAIRASDLILGVGENAYRCSVIKIVENPVSYMVMLEPFSAQGTSYIAWEISKHQWNHMKKTELGINIPADALMFLREE